MHIKKEVTVTLSVKEAETILKEWVEKHKGIKVDSVYFNINSHEQEGDWRSEFPLIYSLDEVICKGAE